MQLILNLLNKDFKFTDNQLHDALRRSSGGLFNSQHGLGKIVDRFAKNEFQNDAAIGNAFIVTKNTLKINDLSHLYNLAQIFRRGDKAKKIKQNHEKYAICLALICHQQVQQNAKDFDLKYLDELYSYYAANVKMEPAIKAKRIEILNLPKHVAKASIALARSGSGSKSKSEEKQDSPTPVRVVSQKKQPQQEKLAQQASPPSPALSEKSVLVPPSPLKRSVSRDGANKFNLTIEIPRPTLPDASLDAVAFDPLKAAASNLSGRRGLSPIHIVNFSPLGKTDSPVNRSHVPANSLPLTPPTTPVSPVLASVKEGAQAAAELSQPSYASIYQAQEKARWWKTALAFAVAILTLPTIILPVLSYVLWRRAKQNELIQKVELTASSYASLKEFRQGLNTPKLENEKMVKPQKQVVPAADPNGKSVYYLDKEQAKRFQFFDQRLKQGQTAALNDLERQLLLKSKQESVNLAPRLGR